VHLIPRYSRNGEFARGGTRYVIPGKAEQYWTA
jgi:hypothetical protein